MKDRTERYKFAYTYRDWLIKAFNEDMPYETFVRSQVAGDLLDDKVHDKAIPGLGMNGLGVWHMTNMAPAIERADDWSDRVDVTTKAFLGLLWPALASSLSAAVLIREQRPEG